MGATWGMMVTGTLHEDYAGCARRVLQGGRPVRFEDPVQAVWIGDMGSPRENVIDLGQRRSGLDVLPSRRDHSAKPLHGFAETRSLTVRTSCVLVRLAF